jgi:SAM-dependent methyltransferase
VLDLGAGTGKLTGCLVELGGFEVVAVEPDEKMRAQLTQLLPRVQAHAGSAEHIPLPDAAVDAIFVGQALHWFDLDLALPEMDRVLRPGGAVIAMWNARDGRETPWLAGLQELMDETSLLDRDRSDRTYPPFDGPEYAEVRHAQRRTADSLVATLGTESSALTLPGDERAQRMRMIRDYLGSRPETASGEFDVPLTTLVMRLVKP